MEEKINREEELEALWRDTVLYGFNVQLRTRNGDIKRIDPKDVTSLDLSQFIDLDTK